MKTHEELGAGEAQGGPRRSDLAREQALAAGPVGQVGAALDASAVLRLQRSAGNASVARLVGEPHEEEESPVKDVIGSGGGTPLAGPLRHEMEASLGHDFSDVRIHTDGRAAESARAINAHAYTSGTDVVFASGQFAPGTESGKRTLAHELTHVVQQKAGPVAGSAAPGGILLSDPGDAFEREADHMADQVMSGGKISEAAGPAGPGAGVQRQEAEEEEVQASFVQRQEEEEEASESG